VKPTSAQQRVIDHRGRSALVSASAGSGKTTVVAQRCLALISDPAAGVNVDDLLIVTFTRAAAAELRARIAQALRRAAAASADLRESDHLRRQIMRLDRAHIGTIDAWCARLVREHFAEIDVDPGFSTLSAQGAALLREQVMDELIEWVASDVGETAAAARDWLARHQMPDDELLRSAVRVVSRYLDRLPDPEQWLRSTAVATSPADAAGAEGAAAALLRAGLSEECALQRPQVAQLVERVGDARVAALLAEYVERLDAWAATGESPAAVRATAEAIGAFSMTKPRKTDPADTAVFELVRERWLKRRLQARWGSDVAAPVLDHAAEAAGLVRTTLALVERYEAQLAAAKRARSAYEFADVQRFAYRLLTDASGEPTAVALALRERYHEILIDECQDTSPMQMAILGRIARRDAERSNCCYVGDVKQSIYGFRDADPTLFCDLERAFESGARDGAVLPLADNFRSHARLIAAANHLFARLFDASFGGAAYDERHALVARRAEPPNPTLDGAPRFEIYAFETARAGQADSDTDDADGEPLERIEREGQLIARRIRALIDAGTLVLDGDAAGDAALRPMRYADVVVLLRSARGKAYQLAAMLRAHHIPAVAAGREPLSDSIEAMDVHAILSLIAHRRQDVPLAAFLRGPAARIEADDLLRIRAHATRERSFADAVLAYAANGPDASLRARVAAALEKLDRWRAWAREEPAPDVVRRVIREGGLEDWAATQPGGG